MLKCEKKLWYGVSSEKMRGNDLHIADITEIDSVWIDTLRKSLGANNMFHRFVENIVFEERKNMCRILIYSFHHICHIHAVPLSSLNMGSMQSEIWLNEGKSKKYDIVAVLKITRLNSTMEASGDHICSLASDQTNSKLSMSIAKAMQYAMNKSRYLSWLSDFIWLHLSHRKRFSGLHKFHLDNILSRESRVLLIEEFAEYLWLCIVSDASNASIRIDNKKSCWHSCKSNWNKYDFSVLVDELIFPTWTVGIFFCYLIVCIVSETTNNKRQIKKTCYSLWMC